jgi:hypothetical protein
MKQKKSDLSIGYLYRWTQLSTGKWYVGARGGKGCHPDDGYICSSKIVKPLILENPKDWIREILHTGDTEKIFDLEASLLHALKAKDDPNSFNKHNGDGKWSMRGKTFNAEHRKKMAAWQIGRKFNEASIEKRTASRKDFKHSKEAKLKISAKLKGRDLGVPKSEEVKLKISNTLTGRKNGPLSNEHKALLSFLKKGFKHTPESIRKMKDSHSGKVLTENHKLKISLSSKGHKKSDQTKERMKRPKIKSPCPSCGLLCSPHLMQRHINAKHLSKSTE